MNKREFVKSVGAGLAGLGLGSNAFSTQSAARDRKNKNYAWVTLERQRTADEWRRTLATWRAAGLDGIIVEAYDGRNAYFPSTRLPVKTDRLGLILPGAQAEELEVHAWMWSMPCMVEEIMRTHPDWYNVNAKRESALDQPAYVDYYRFLDPANPEVREWVQGTVEELAAMDGVQAVHLDYIRYPDVILPRQLWAKYGLVQDRVLPQFDYGYTEYSRAQFKKKHGVDPLRITDPEMQKAWVQYRWDAVTDLVNDYLVPAAHKAGKKISAAVFPGPTLARQMVYQNWGDWKLDSYHPMLYHSFYQADAKWVGEQTREGVSTVKAPIYSGLFVPDVVEAGLKPLIAAALEAGAAGVTLFHGDGMSPSMWRAFSQVVRR